MRDIRGTMRGRRSRRAWRGAAVGLLATGLLAGLAAVAVPASARPQRQPAKAAALTASHQRLQIAAGRFRSRRGRFLGIVPTRRAADQAAPAVASANGTPPLRYNGGPVQHSSTVYAIFWQPAGYYYSPAYRATVSQYFSDLSQASYKTSNVYAAATQYYDKTGPGGSKNWVSYDVRFGGSAVVKDPLPAGKCANYTMSDGSSSRRCLTDGQLASEITKVISAHGWTTGLGNEYFLFTPKQLGDCFDTRFADGCYDPSANSSTAFCAYHSWIGSNLLYAVLPWADLTGGCQYSVPHSPSPNDDGADIVINLISHEQNETMTDPLGTGWLDNTGEENGDECAWLSLSTSYNGIGDFSQVISGDDYLMQYEWSNRAKKCVAANTFAQPSGSFAASAGVPTHGESFTASASDADGDTFSYGWQFGDGSSSLTASAAAVHTYAAAGTYTVTLVIFDSHGDQVRIVKDVSVS
jgi:hypothetical protein